MKQKQFDTYLVCTFAVIMVSRNIVFFQDMPDFYLYSSMTLIKAFFRCFANRINGDENRGFAHNCYFNWLRNVKQWVLNSLVWQGKLDVDRLLFLTALTIIFTAITQILPKDICKGNKKTSRLLTLSLQIIYIIALFEYSLVNSISITKNRNLVWLKYQGNISAYVLCLYLEAAGTIIPAIIENYIYDDKPIS